MLRLRQEGAHRQRLQEQQGQVRSVSIRSNNATGLEEIEGDAREAEHLKEEEIVIAETEAEVEVAIVIGEDVGPDLGLTLDPDPTLQVIGIDEEETEETVTATETEIVIVAGTGVTALVVEIVTEIEGTADVMKDDAETPPETETTTGTTMVVKKTKARGKTSRSGRKAVKTKNFPRATPNPRPTQKRTNKHR